MGKLPMISNEELHHESALLRHVPQGIAHHRCARLGSADAIFFLTIEKPAELIDDAMQVEDDRFLYSNMHETDPFGHDLDYYREVLRHFQIIVPESLFREVLSDAEMNVGNRFVRHQADGSFTELGR